ncbi:HTH-type transcriptional repressor NicS [compost metagenome]
MRIVSIENIHHGEYVKKSTAIRSMSNTMLHSLDDILRRGEAAGLFRSGVDSLDLHLLISSFCFYRMSNRHTIGEIFQIDLSDEQVKQRHKAMICDAVLRYIQA